MASTFIAYTLENARMSPICNTPPYEQIICSCETGTRSIAVGRMTRCDHIPPSNFIIQRGPVGTLIVVDSGSIIYSYLLRVEEYTAEHHSASLSSLPEALCVIPFATCTVMGTDAYVYNNSGGILTILGMGNSIYVTITIYGQSGILAKPCDNFQMSQQMGPRRTDDEIVQKNDGSQNMDDVETITLEPEYPGCRTTFTIAGHTNNIPGTAEVSDAREDLLAEAIREARLYISDPSCISDAGTEYEMHDGSLTNLHVPESIGKCYEPCIDQSPVYRK
ncbi:UL4 nuclear protein [Meleagrid alphaherpesvirus 1]|uniref:UL4 nuclear protein n=1 Tax=Meleagrid herpesvirus 1 TaxID=37108 RepID=Q9DPT0_MEHV1|nr:nuclear protein UL4 [Meleagrid alphaherpesvirus 1]AKQ48631.1 nuclear protein UL4 [iBAC vector pMeHV1-C7]AKQ48703.1 nuclear protein UL4 [iBAC vector pMeHV1-C9]AKQ48775.1 nuclear protein UL4 [iBAC vector pMeHV1-C10]AKQ48847.1 nuclear protein UL4 [iBAC vector pMeHV1-C17]AKQ48920.1 nuclear protein UL4 [iBAC vector pMeHV1-C18]